MRKVFGLIWVAFFAFGSIYFAWDTLSIARDGVSLLLVIEANISLVALMAAWFCYQAVFPKNKQWDEEVWLISFSLKKIDELIARYGAVFCGGQAKKLLENQKEINRRILRGDKKLAQENFPSRNEAEQAITACVAALDTIQQLIEETELQIGKRCGSISEKQRTRFRKHLARCKEELAVIRAAAEKYK
ncbi:MAG: hypothetical protein WC120_05755 [Parcubacteria group bacterium]